MEHLTLEATPPQRRNLEKLADYLATGKTAMRFDMGIHCASADEKVLFGPDQHSRGSVASALGHGPAAGIGPEARTEEWYAYCETYFCKPGRSYIWLFGAYWEDIDNTPQGAAARIYYALEHGIPKNYSAQIGGTAALSYGVPS